MLLSEVVSPNPATLTPRLTQLTAGDCRRKLSAIAQRVHAPQLLVKVCPLPSNILSLSEYQTLQVNEWLSHRTGIEVKHLDLLAYTFACACASFQIYQTPVLPDYDTAVSTE